MPELPDVEVYRRRLTPAVRDRRIEHVKVHDGRVLKVSPDTLRKHLKGHRLVKTQRYGKWILAEIADDDRWLALHFGMTGDLVPHATDEGEPRYTRLDLVMGGGASVAFTSRRQLGRIDLVADPRSFAEQHDLGPDALGIKPDVFLERLEGKSGAIKNALMDQKTLAGIGNVYADEILFHAHVHPKTPVDRLDKQDRKRIHRNMQHVFERAVKAGADPKKMPKGWLVPVRGQKDATCPRDGTRLRQTKVGGRTTLWCPNEV